MALGLCIGALFFVGVLGTAIAYDLKRNRGVSDPTPEWNPLLFWKVLLQAGACLFLLGAFFFYRQGWWLGLAFTAFAILCGLAARTMVVTVRLPQRARGAEVEGSHVPGFGKPDYKHWAGGHLHRGFVAMEYFALILNRSFLIFLTDEGLHGWRFHGAVSSFEPLFYEPVEALLDDPDMAPDSQAFNELMKRRHTFLWPYTEIESVDFVNRQKWGMGPIPHAGRIRLKFKRFGRHRELILLGNPHGQIIRDAIASWIKPH